VQEDATTAELVRRAQDGDASAFSTLAQAFLRPAYAVALAVVGRVADAEDVAQDAVMTALSRIDTCRSADRFGAWLLQIVRNRARNHLASRRLRDVPAREPLEADLGSTSPARRDAGLARELETALERLSPAQREVLVLHDLHGWTHPEIAGNLEISEVMSRQHLFQARRAMRARLAERGVVHGSGS
jgi:RNA polymerase sigma-70 factor (ECF subfamily)